MQKNTLRMLAEKNLRAFSSNPYPGCCIIIGQNVENTHIIHAYAITGNDEDNRNQILVTDPNCGSVRSELFDKKVENPSLDSYDVMLESEGYYAISNGEQTESALTCAYSEVGLMGTKFPEEYEYYPDGPNLTPRITAVTTLDTDSLTYSHEFLIIKKSLYGPDSTLHYHVICDIAPGFGYIIHTYNAGGSPFPSFTGEPYILPLEGEQSVVANTLWNALHPENRVSLAVKFIEVQTGKSTIMIINKHKVVSA